MEWQMFLTKRVGGELHRHLLMSKTMAKIGRNEPCPCDSGKKFKKCHGLLPAGNLNFEHLGTVSTKAKAAEFKLPGLPGMNLDIVLHAGYSDRESLRNV